MTSTAPSKPIDVLVVEDSRVIRDYLLYILGEDPDLRVVGAVESGEAALEFLQIRRPDVILMDIHLPGIDGLETTRRIMSTDPVPVIVCTASAHFGDMTTAMRALEAGAVAALKKPKGLGDPDAEQEAAAIVQTLKLMSEIKLVRRFPGRTPPLATTASGGARLAAQNVGRHDVAAVAVAASTGGPPVLAQILSGLTVGFSAPILVVQHISDGFTEGLAEWLASTSKMPVHVARPGTVPLAGHVYLAPDGRHLKVGARGELETPADEPQQSLRPSAGVLFRSVAERFGSRAIGVLLTGMGRDGAEELKLMADRGALTVAQDEESCVVFGMPGEAVRLGAARFVLAPSGIVDLLNAAVPPAPGGKGHV